MSATDRLDPITQVIGEERRSDKTLHPAWTFASDLGSVKTGPISAGTAWHNAAHGWILGACDVMSEIQAFVEDEAMLVV